MCVSLTPSPMEKGSLAQEAGKGAGGKASCDAVTAAAPKKEAEESQLLMGQISAL